VGHSLGGQLAGNAARKIKEKSSNTIKIHRVTALDPAFPPFYPGFLYKPLGKRDANLVSLKFIQKISVINKIIFFRLT
jgi:pimeloyl-ACP methyl ester carboxylesterase